MRKKELYVFTGDNRAAAYGIGAYIFQLIKALKDTEWKLNIVYLYAQGKEVEIIEKRNFRQINIPFPSGKHPNANQYYLKIISFILRDIIPEDRNTDYIFHINFMMDSCFIKYFKQHFRCKILLVAHYTEWSFALLGDTAKLKNLLLKSKKELKDHPEKSVVKSFRSDVNMIKKVDRLVCVAQHTWDVFRKIGAIPNGKTEIINNALEDIYKPLSIKEKIYLRLKYYLNDNTRLVLFAGRLDEVKGVAFLIKAFKNLLKTNPDTCLLIAGDGDYYDLIKESENAWSRIIFTGRLDKKKLYELYQIASIGVVCSLHEEFGFIAIEMMMHALPVIVTKTGGLDEIVEDKVSGLKIQIRTIKGKRQPDMKQLEEKMRFLLNDSVCAKKLGENGRKRFLEKYELSVFKEKMLNLYRNI